MLVDLVWAKILHGNRVVDRLAASLDRERVARIAKLQALTLDCADADAPVLGWAIRQLGNVGSILAALISLAFLVHRLDLLSEFRELWNQQVVVDGLENELEVWIRPHVLASERGAQLLDRDLLGQFGHGFNHVRDSWIITQDSLIS